MFNDDYPWADIEPNIYEGGQSSGDQYDGPVSFKVQIGGGDTVENTAPNIGIARSEIAAIGGADSYLWWIYHPDGTLLDSGSVKAPDDGGVDTGGTGGYTGEGGSTGGETGGTGEEGAVTFKYTLYGWVWKWTNKTGDPRLWTGEASEPVISEAGGYGSAQDALEAGKAVGDADEAVMKVIVESEIPGFAGASHIYTERLQAAQNAVAAEKNAATGEEFSEGGTLVLPPAGPGILPEVPVEAVGAVVAVLAVTVCAAVVFALWRGAQ